METGEAADLIIQSFEGKVKNLDLRTAVVRKESAKAFSRLAGKDIETVFKECEILLETGKWAMGVVAYDWAFRVRDRYNHETFEIFERWLKTYVKGWGDCDDFCTHAFGALIAQNNTLFDRVLKWTDSDNFCLRRASAVILIYPIRKQRIGSIDPFKICDRLMHDENIRVQKGYGWMLKVLAETRREPVIEYLLRNRAKMPRLPLRYAVEKMTQEEKAIILKGQYPAPFAPPAADKHD